jgi:hypothetical protein
MLERRTYSPEFNRQAVELNRMEGIKISQFERDQCTRTNMLECWRREVSAGAVKAFQGQGVVRDKEMPRLKWELAR